MLFSFTSFSSLACSYSSADRPGERKKTKKIGGTYWASTGDSRMALPQRLVLRERERHSNECDAVHPFLSQSLYVSESTEVAKGQELRSLSAPRSQKAHQRPYKINDTAGQRQEEELRKLPAV